MNENAIKNWKETFAGKGIDFEAKVEELGNQYIGYLQNAMDEAETDIGTRVRDDLDALVGELDSKDSEDMQSALEEVLGAFLHKWIHENF